jgi:hypothetical protein
VSADLAGFFNRKRNTGIVPFAPRKILKTRTNRTIRNILNGRNTCVNGIEAIRSKNRDLKYRFLLSALKKKNSQSARKITQIEKSTQDKILLVLIGIVMIISIES